MNKTIIFFLLSLFVLAVITGCNSADDMSNIPTTQDVQPIEPEVAEEKNDLEDTTESIIIEPGEKDFTAEDVVSAFVDAGLPVGEVIIFTEETCPNDLLGRPGQYIGKASWEDTRIEQYGDEPKGGTLETFDSQDLLEKREEYLKALITELPMFTQYMYVHKNVILRIDKELTPSQAEEYNDVLIQL